MNGIIVDKNEKKKTKLRDTRQMLEIINKREQRELSTRPKDIIGLYFEKQLDGISDEKKKKDFIQQHRYQISRILGHLKKLGLVQRSEVADSTDKRDVQYKLTPKGKDMIVTGLFEIDHTIQQSTNEQIDLYKVEYHSNRIRDLIDLMIHEIEHALDRKVVPDHVNDEMILRKVKRFGFEDDILFEDLNNHDLKIIHYKQLLDMIKGFKNLVIRYYQLKKNVYDLIVKELTRDLEMGYSPQPNLDKPLSNNLADWVFEGMDFLSQQKRDYYLEYFTRFEMKKINWKREGSRLTALEIGGIKMITCEDTSDNRKKIKYAQVKLKEIMTTIEERPFYKEFIEMEKCRADIDLKRDEIILTLKKMKEIPIYEGTCQYLK